MSFKIEFRGLDRFLKMLNGLSSKLRAKAETKLYNYMIQVRDDAKDLCPVDTGSLQKSIRLQTYTASGNILTKMGVRAGGYIINPKTGRLVDYAYWIEFGNSRSPAQPFLRPAWDNNMRTLHEIVQEIMRESVTE